MTYLGAERHFACTRMVKNMDPRLGELAPTTIVVQLLPYFLVLYHELREQHSTNSYTTYGRVGAFSSQSLYDLRKATAIVQLPESLMEGILVMVDRIL